MALEFHTKAQTLEALVPHLAKAQIPPIFRFSVGDWNADRSGVLKQIERLSWFSAPVIVRSSSRSEDSSRQSLAGHFVSVGDVLGLEKTIQAIETVVASLSQGSEDDQVFLQPMLQQVTLSGVAFSRDPNTGSSYIVINYDDTTRSTTSVTSGQSNNLKTFVVYKYAEREHFQDFHDVVDLIQELETLFAHDSLDVEFARDNAGRLFLLQVRPLVNPGRKTSDETRFKNALTGLHRKISLMNGQKPYIFGERAVFGIMPDWNPAEIIGVRPRPLALSLYKDLITDSIWAYQRDNYGYRNLRSFPLLQSFHGLPYIDVRLDFNSFIPKEISSELAERLVNHYLDRLIAYPNLHDKVEFEIVYSCYTFDLPQRLEELHGFGFSIQECKQIEESLRGLTNTIIHGEKGLWRKDAEKIGELENRQKIILNSNLDKVAKIYWLCEDCKRYGTLPFAGLARAAFIAVQLLRSMIQVGILSEDDYESFISSLKMVSTTMGEDFSRLSRPDFLEKYGHLRPGTYDILSARYDEEPDRYFDWSGASPQPNRSPRSFSLTLDQFKKIDKFLKDHHLDHDVLGLFNFLEKSIEGREHSKFVFTRSLSAVIALFKELCAENGISPEEASFANIEVIKTLYG